MNDKLYLPQGRFGALLLLLPDLRTITHKMVKQLKFAEEMGITQIDGLLSEILLASKAKRRPTQTACSVTVGNLSTA